LNNNHLEVSFTLQSVNWSHNVVQPGNLEHGSAAKTLVQVLRCGCFSTLFCQDKERPFRGLIPYPRSPTACLNNYLQYLYNKPDQGSNRTVAQTRNCLTDGRGPAMVWSPIQGS